MGRESAPYDLLEVNRPRPGWHTLSGGTLPYPVAVRLERGPDGRVVITGLEIGKPHRVEVTVRSLRAIPLPAITQALAADLASEDPTRRFIAATIFEPAIVRHPGPAGHSREHFAGVADAYRDALQVRTRAPMQALRQRYPGVSEATIRRWVQRSRDMGLLGPSQPGKAGEQPTESRTKGKKP